MSDFLEITVNEDDLAPPPFESMPNGLYTTKLLRAEHTASDAAEQVTVYVGNEFVATENGHKSYNRSKGKRFGAWARHSNAEAQRIGRTDLVRIAQAFGLAAEGTDANGKKTYSFPQISVADFVAALNALAGTPVKAFVKNEQRKKNGVLVFRTDDPTKPVIDENVKRLEAAV